MAAKAQGKGNGKAERPETPSEDRDALNMTLAEALAPIELEEPDMSIDDLVKKLQQRISKQSAKYFTDSRANQRGTATLAKGLIEEFVESTMQACQLACSEKPWFPKVDFSKPLLAAALYTFKDSKCFNRTLQPLLEKHIEEGVFKWQEEERIQKAMWDAVESSGVAESHKKKANVHIQKAFDEAYMKSPYGSNQAESTEMSFLQDFVKGWIGQFVMRAWDVLENGLANGNKDEQVLFLTKFFQSLCDPSVACLPFEIVQALEGGMPPAPWDFVGKAVEEVFQEANDAATENASASAAGQGWAKKRKTSHPTEEKSDMAQAMTAAGAGGNSTFAALAQNLMRKGKGKGY